MSTWTKTNLSIQFPHKVPKKKDMQVKKGQILNPSKRNQCLRLQTTRQQVLRLLVNSIEVQADCL